MLQNTHLCLLKGLSGGSWFSISPLSNSQVDPFFLHLVMGVSVGPMGCPSRRLLSSVPTKTVPDPHPGSHRPPSMDYLPIFCLYGQKRRAPVCDWFCLPHRCHCTLGELKGSCLPDGAINNQLHPGKCEEIWHQDLLSPQLHSLSKEPVWVVHPYTRGSDSSWGGRNIF